MKSEDLCDQSLRWKRPGRSSKCATISANARSTSGLPSKRDAAAGFSVLATVPPGSRAGLASHQSGQFRCLIHAVPPPKAAGEAPLWCGDGDLPFTRAMSRQIASMLLKALSSSPSALS